MIPKLAKCVLLACCVSVAQAIELTLSNDSAAPITFAEVQYWGQRFPVPAGSVVTVSVDASVGWEENYTAACRFEVRNAAGETLYTFPSIIVANKRLMIVPWLGNG